MFGDRDRPSFVLNEGAGRIFPLSLLEERESEDAAAQLLVAADVTRLI